MTGRSLKSIAENELAAIGVGRRSKPFGTTA